MEYKFKQVHTAKDLTISAIVLAAGIGLFFLNPALGVLVAVCGILMLLLYRAGYKREGEENVVLHKKALDVSYACRQSLKDFLDGKDEEPQLITGAPGGIVRLEVYLNAEASVAYARLFDFSDYTYQASTPIVELRGEKAQKLISKL